MRWVDVWLSEGWEMGIGQGRRFVDFVMVGHDGLPL